MTISFLHPYALLLLLALPALWTWRGNRAHCAIRTLVMASLIVALARPVVLSDGGERYRVLVLDLSESVTVEQRELASRSALQWLADIKERERAVVVLLGDADARQFTAAGAVVRLQGGRSTSSLSAALAEAGRQVPNGSAADILLVSDGLATDRRWGPTVQSLIERGIVVDTVDLGTSADDVYLSGVYPEGSARVGQTLRVGVAVQGAAESARVRLLDAQGHELSSSAPFSSAGKTRVSLEFEPSTSGYLKLRAEVTVPSGDADTANNAISTTLAVQPPLRLLYLGERVQGGARRLEQLLGRGFNIEDASARDLSSGMELRNYDLVVIDDRPAEAIPLQLQEALSAAVRDHGLGLMYSGGKAAFGAGGYENTRLARMLPVEIAPSLEKRDPTTALAVVIDTSGSMNGSRLDLAKQVARLAARRLKAHDRVGIVEFYGNKQWALPMQSAANKISIDRAVGRLQASGGTVILPAIEEAMYGLKNVRARYKHILILTDAGIENADFEALMQRMVAERITVSTVLVGAQAHNQNLMDIAAWGRGRFYAASDRYSLPDIVFKQPTEDKRPEYRSGSFDVVARGRYGWWGDAEHGPVPRLDGYVETRARPAANVLLEVNGDSHPVVASWHYGLGRVTAMMTEPVGAGTRSWKHWSAYGRWLARLAERTANDTQPFLFAMTRDARAITLTAHRQSIDRNIVPQASLINADDSVGAAIDFRQLAPDIFSAEIAADPDSELRAVARAVGTADVPVQQDVLLVSAAASDVLPELQVDPGTAMDLAALARITAEGAATGSTHLFHLWWYALWLALLLYLGELLYRRWPESRA